MAVVTVRSRAEGRYGQKLLFDASSNATRDLSQAECSAKSRWQRSGGDEADRRWGGWERRSGVSHSTEHELQSTVCDTLASAHQ